MSVTFEAVAHEQAVRPLAAHLSVSSHASAATLVVWYAVAVVVATPVAACLSPHIFAGCPHLLYHADVVFVGVAHVVAVAAGGDLGIPVTRFARVLAPENRSFVVVYAASWVGTVVD